MVKQYLSNIFLDFHTREKKTVERRNLKQDQFLGIDVPQLG